LDRDIATADKNLRTNAEPALKAKYKAEKERFEKEKEAQTVKAIDAYIAAVRSGRTNPNALDFVLRELGKLLPGRGEHARMRDLYKEVYDWDHADPKSLNYLYEVIKATERMGDKPEFAQQADAVQKRFSAQLAAARKKVDDLVKTSGKPEEITAAKAAVAKLSTELAAELDVVEKARQASILAAKTEALGILSGAVAESINDRKQEGSEKLILFLAEKLARKVKRVKPGMAVDPNAYSAANAEDEITKLLRLEENKDSLIAQARGFFAKGQLATFLRDPAKADSYFKKISANYKAEELSPTILAIVGDHMLAKGETKNSEAYFQYIMEHHRSSEYADFGFAGLAEIRLTQKKYKEALELCAEAIDNSVVMSKEKEIRFIKARALAESQKYAEAKAEFEEIAKTKEWKGETTAGCLYWLGLMEERQGNHAEAVAYYRRTYQAWKKYEVWSAKAYLGAARLFATKLDQKKDAKEIITEMLSKDRIKDTPEAAEARILSTKL
jgi:tetratricopeptide (TPR) repeat protein